MHLERGLIFLIFLLVIPIVNSSFNFQCSDETLFGECNDNGEICAGSENLIQDNWVSLSPGKEYLFFGFIENGCYLDLYDLYIGNKIIPLSLSGRGRVVAEFTADNFFGGLVNVKCRANIGNVELTNKYLGEVSDDIGLFTDLNFCMKDDEKVIDVEAVNAEISIATNVDQYWDNARIMLTDPPSFEKPLEKITGNVVRTSDLVLNEAVDNNQRFITGLNEDETVEPNGYIIEFEDEPVLVRKVRLEKEAEETRYYVDTHSTYNPFVRYKIYFGVFPNEVDDDIRRYSNNLRSKNLEIKGRIFDALNEENKITGNAVSDGSANARILHEYRNVFNGIALDISEEEAENLKTLLGVKNVYPNYPVKVLLQDSVDLINADNVWNLRDDNGEFLTGKGVDIAIIDTGVDYTHPDLGSCSSDQFLDGNCEKVIGGYDFVDDDPDPMDCDGHGTHVAATVAGNGALKGVAPGANIYAYRVLNCWGSGYDDVIIAAVERAMDPNEDNDFSDHLDIISMSLGGSPIYPDDPMALAVNNAVNAGVVAVIAAGNDGHFGESTIGSPGIAKNAVTVGAVDKQIRIADFSSRGPALDLDGITQIDKPDIVAPGVDICAAAHVGPDSCNNDDLHFAISGTSMATPHVAGAAAILIQKNPDWTSFEIKEALRSTAMDLGLDVNTQGTGFLDVLRAVSLEGPPAIIYIDSVNRDRTNVIITGTVTHPDFHKYEIYIKQGENKFNKIYESFNQVSNDIIVTFSHTSLEIGRYELELRVYDRGRNLIGNKIISFNVPNVEILNVVNDGGVDKDGDGAYDTLVVELSAYARTYESGEMQAELEIEEERLFVPLSFGMSAYPYSVIEGDNIIRFEFEGDNIRRELANNGFDFDENVRFKLNIIPIEGERRRVFDLINEYNIDDFDETVDLEAANIELFGERVFLDSKNRMSGIIRNNGNTPFVGKVYVYETKPEETELNLVHYAQIFEERFDEINYIDFDYIPDIEGEHKLRLAVEADDDINSENNIKDIEISVYPRKPDLTGFFTGRRVLIYNESNSIQVKIENNGRANARDVNISLYYINPENVEEKNLIDERTVDVRAGSFEFEEVDFEWKPEIKGDIILRLEIEAEEDITLEDNIREANYFVIANAPDIEVGWIDVEGRLRVNEKTGIGIVLYNNGPKDAENVSVIVSGELNGEKFEINRSYIEKVDGDGWLEYTIEWTPVEVGEYKLEAVAETENDDNLNNNRRDRFVDVLPDAPDVAGYYRWKEDKPIINLPYNLIFAISNEGFRSAERINVSLFKRTNGEELIGSDVVEAIAPGQKEEISFSWTPEAIGWTEFDFIVEAENDANPENNLYGFGLKVLKEKPDVRIWYQHFGNIVVNKENKIEFSIENIGGRESNDILASLYQINEIDGEEILLDSRKMGILEGGRHIFSEFNYMPGETGIKKFKLKAIVENDDDLSNNEKDIEEKIVPQSRLVNLGDNALSGHLFLEFQKENDNKWESYLVLIDDQRDGSIRTLEKGETLAIDKLYNELGEYIIGKNINDRGRYRVYVAFFDENRKVIENYDGRKLEASYQFRIFR